jgi:hypothetical protein
MKQIILTDREQSLANYMVDTHKRALNSISKSCISPLVAIRQTLKQTAEAIGRTELQSQEPLTHDEWLNTTRWINNEFFAD